MPPKVPGLGESIRRMREAAGLSGNALAKAAGISQGHLWNIESGRSRDPGVSVVVAIARSLNVTVDALLGTPPAAPARAPRGRRNGGTGR